MNCNVASRPSVPLLLSIASAVLFIAFAHQSILRQRSQGTLDAQGAPVCVIYNVGPTGDISIDSGVVVAIWADGLVAFSAGSENLGREMRFGWIDRESLVQLQRELEITRFYRIPQGCYAYVDGSFRIIRTAHSFPEHVVAWNGHTECLPREGADDIPRAWVSAWNIICSRRPASSFSIPTSEDVEHRLGTVRAFP